MTDGPPDPALVFADLPTCFVNHSGPVIEWRGRPCPQVAEVTYLLREDGFYVHLRMAIEDDAPEITQLTFTSALGYKQRITQPWLRKLDLNEIRDAAVEAMLRQAAIRQFERSGVGSLRDLGRITVDPPTTGRRRIVTDALLAEVSEVYKSDESGRPTMAVSQAMNTSHRNASRWIATARERGFLPPKED